MTGTRSGYLDSTPGSQAFFQSNPKIHYFWNILKLKYINLHYFWILDSQFSSVDHLQSSCFQKFSSSLNQVQALRSDLFCFICSLRQLWLQTEWNFLVMDSKLISPNHSQPFANICRLFGPQNSLQDVHIRASPVFGGVLSSLCLVLHHFKPTTLSWQTGLSVKSGTTYEVMRHKNKIYIASTHFNDDQACWSQKMMIWRGKYNMMTNVKTMLNRSK